MLIVVSGAPCSGKSTYVREHLGVRDVVFDYDAIANAFTGKSTHTLADKHHARPFVLAMRNAAVEAWRRGVTGAENFYLITSSLSPNFWAVMDTVEHEVVEMETCREECLARLAADETRPEKDSWTAAINKYFDRKENGMGKQAQRSADGKKVVFSVMEDIRPDTMIYNWQTGRYDRQESTTSQRYFAEHLEGLTAENTVELYINSMGGSVKEALGIVNALRRCPARVVAYVDGFAASAASVITQGADEIYMPKNTCMLLHNARWVAEGNPKELRKSADDLEVINQSIINSYAARAGDKLPAAVLQQILDDETWLTAEDCVRYGLADGLTDYDADLDKAAEALRDTPTTAEAAAKLPDSLAARLRVLPAAKAGQQEPERHEPPATPPVKKSAREKLANAIMNLEV